MNAAAGLGAFGFWMFLTAVVVAGIWFDARKRESQQETLRRLVESGRELDPATLDRLLSTGGRDRVDKDLKIGGMIVLAAAPGLAALGWFLGMIAEEAPASLYGVSVLVGFVGIGLLVAGKWAERWDRDDKG